MRNLFINTSLVLISSLLALFAAEAGLRLWSAATSSQPAEASEAPRPQEIIACGTEFDPELGWKPVPLRQGVNSSGKRVSILATGVRSNGQETPSGRPLVLAVGDSFTFGGKVADDQSWPAALERSLHSPVLNGGVCGYGIGQSVRRAELLLERFRPDLLIVGMIPTDIDRTRAFEFYGRSKPYFELTAGELVYRKEHLTEGLGRVLSQPMASGGERSFLDVATEALDDHSLLWRSLPDVPYMIDRVASRIALIRGTAHTYFSADGVAISCQLLRRIKSLGQADGFRPFLLVQYKYRDILNRMELEAGEASRSDSTDMAIVADTIALIGCADRIGVPVIDTFAALKEVYLNDGRTRLAELYGDHMTAKGNAFVAEVIHQELKRISAIDREDR